MFKQAITVFLKELKCIIRDKKTFVFGLLLPLLLVPSMLFVIDFSMKGTQGQVTKNINVAINNKENSLFDFLNAQDIITIVDVSNPQKALDSGEVSAYINVGDNIDEQVVAHKAFQLDIKYSESSINSMMSKAIISQFEEAYRYLAQNHEFKDIQELRKTANVNLGLDLGKDMPTMDTSSLYFSMLVPMMLILYCCMGSSGTAVDLTAGEKERGTLEPLLSTSADRTSIVLGKLLATTLMGVTSGLCTALGLWGYLLISSGLGSSKISALGMVYLLIMTVFIAMFFASINLTIGVYAKSSKEAQLYLMPISLLCVIPTSFTYTLEAAYIKISDLCIPVYNIICIIKELLAGIINISHLAIVLVWLVIYISVALYVALKLFKKESVIFKI